MKQLSSKKMSGHAVNKVPETKFPPVYLFLICFLSCSVLSISFIPMHSLMLVSLISILVFCLFLTTGRVIIYRKSAIYPFGILLILIFFSIFANLWAESLDLAFAKSLAAIVANSVPAALLISVLIKRELNKHGFVGENENDCLLSFIRVVQFSMVIIAVTVIVSALNPGFRQLVDNVFPAQGNILDNSHPDYFYRIRGILPSTGASASVFFAFGCFFSIFLISKSGKLLSLYYLLSSLLLSVAITLNGRTGFLAMATFIVVYLFLSVVQLGKKTYTLLCVKKKSVFGLIVLLIALVVIFVAGYNVAEIIAEDAVKRLAKDFFLIISGDMQNSTLGGLYKMIIFPNNSLNFFFGDVSTYSVNRISSDIGYIRVLNSIGFFGAMAYYFFWLIVSYKIVKNISDKVFKKNMTSFLVVVFVLEAKEPFFSYLFVAVLILTFYVLLVIKPRLKVNAHE